MRVKNKFKNLEVRIERGKKEESPPKAGQSFEDSIMKLLTHVVMSGPLGTSQ